MKCTDHQWEKVLWKTQGFGDNYIHPQYFLESLRKNPNFKPYTYWSLVLFTCSITQHVSSVFIFIGIFQHLRDDSLHPRDLLWASIDAFCVGYVLWGLLDVKTSKITTRKPAAERHLKTLKSSILFLLSLMSISPVLRTLTAATSSDSIWAMSATLFSLNVLLADYSIIPTNEHEQERLSSVLSVNAAVSGSVVLASRLSTNTSVFALVLCSLVTFAFFPLLRRLIQRTSTHACVSLTMLLCSVAVTVASSLSSTFTYICFTTLFAITMVAPAMLMWAQKFKNEICGPWDIAIPVVN